MKKVLLIAILLINICYGQSLLVGMSADDGLLPETRMFARAASVTNRPLLFKVNTFVRNMKDSGWWNDVVSLHPYVGSTLTSVSINLKDTSTYRLLFFGSPSVNDTGLVLSGSSQYARTANGEYYLSEILGSNKYTFISRLKSTVLPNATNGAGSIAVSISTDANAALFENTLVNNTTNFRASHRNFTTSASFLFPATTYNLNQYYNLGAVYDGSNLSNFLNGTFTESVPRTGNLSTSVFDNNFRYVAHGARPASLRAGTNSFLTGTFAFALVSKRAHTNAQMSKINTWINDLKSVERYPVDADAKRFLDSIRSKGSFVSEFTEQAVNKLFLKMKGQFAGYSVNYWTDSVLHFYIPIFGLTSSDSAANKFNGRNPSANNLTFLVGSNSVTFSPSGMISGGTGAAALVNGVTNSSLPKDAHGFGVYANTAGSSGTCLIGLTNTSGVTDRSYIFPDFSGTSYYAANQTADNTASGVTRTGFHYVQRTASNAGAAYRNNALVTSWTTASATSSSIPFYILGRNINNALSDRADQRVPFAIFTRSLSSTGRKDIYDMILEFLTELSIN
jgi:hypothetical protein